MLQQPVKGKIFDVLPPEMRAKPKHASGIASRWHILIAEPNREETARAGLSSRGFAPYLPIIHKQILCGRVRKRDVPRAMFACYLFVPLSIGQEPYGQIQSIPGVYDFLTVNIEDDDGRHHRRYATLTEDAVSAIRRREESIESLRQAKIAARVKGVSFEIGQAVAVPVGQFDRLAGKISQVLGKNVEVLLEMEFMGRKAITVSAGHLLAQVDTSTT